MISVGHHHRPTSASTLDAEIIEALARFGEPSAALLDRRALLRRVDTKFAIAIGRVGELVDQLTHDYAALRVPSGCLATYRSRYFDTADLQCFHDHRRGRRIRHKIRIRHYPDREVSYLEVKSKRNAVVTDKHRQKLAFERDELGDREVAFLRSHIGELADGLRPELWIEFQRISLIGLTTDERVTIDLGVSVRGPDGSRRGLGEIAIVEVKQGAFCARTPVMRAIGSSGLRARAGSLSKYAAAIATLRPDVRKNRLLPELRAAARVSG